MQARDVMSTSLVSVTPETDVRAAAALMLERHVSAVVVVEQGDKLAGIVSEGDLMHRAEPGAARRASWWLRLFSSSHDPAEEFVRSHASRVSDIMTRNVVTISEETNLGEIAQLLERHSIKRVPVVRDGRIVGIVARADLLRGLAASRPSMASEAPADDRQIRERILETVRREEIATPVYINVVVQDGVVHLWGMIEKEVERKALMVAAREVPGVKDVQDHLHRAPGFIGV